jgi:hypothetical protein
MVLRAAAGLLAATLWAAPAAAAERPPMTVAERDTIEGVHNAMDHKDCALAVKRLNAGLAAQYPGVYLLAGAMHEGGACVKANWERAARLYQRAHDAGHGAGILRLVAGHALDGRDPAAALWWAQQAPRMARPAECVVPKEVWADADRFVAELKRWPSALLNACVYAVGVQALVTGDAEYPPTAAGWGVEGSLRMRFVPARASIEWETVNVDNVARYGASDGDRLQERNTRGVQRSLLTTMTSLGHRALKRFAQPPGVPEHWRMETTYTFTIVYQ